MGDFPAVVLVLFALGFGAGVVEVASQCPNGEQVHNCLIDPCTHTDCAPGYRCQSNYCGGCNADCVANCSQVMCRMYCVAGFKRDPRGCEICECNDPCLTVKCSSGHVCRNGECVPDGCHYGGRIYAIGQQFPSTDGCNSCTCEAKDAVSCTERACLGCQYGGKSYAVGAQFPATDGCNTCTCQAGNAVACTEIACPRCHYNGQTYNPGDSFPSADGCNKCQCGKDLNIACTKRACQCTPEKPFTECPYNPCIAALCIQGTTCVADQCGGCFARCIPSAPPVQCVVDGKTYKVGESFTASDGCNTCTCSEGGIPVCTLRACNVCPVYKCKACSTGYVIDENGCQTCQCKDPSCEGVTCKSGYYCSDSYCCPDRMKTVRCADPCANMYCGFFKVCKRYCNCYSSCVWWFMAK